MKLNEAYLFENRKIPNRVVFQPMEGCDCEEDGTFSELTRKKYMTFAASGAGTIWFEATAVCEEGRTNARQMMLKDSNLDFYRDFIRELKSTAIQKNGYAPLMILQLTHSGRQSIRPMIAYRNEIYERARPLYDTYIVTDDYLDTLPEEFARTAHLAELAGFDGVDMKSCHGYLLQEMLSAFSRPGKYGGSFENRSRLFLDCVRAIKRTVSADFIVASRISITDMVPYPCGFGTDRENRIDLTEPKRLISELYGLGVRMLNVTLGNPYYNPHVNRPFRVGAYKPEETPETGLARFVTVERELKKTFPDMTVVGSGLSYYRDDLIERAEGLLTDGVCDLVGFGRETLAYPEFYHDALSGKFTGKRCCVTCSRCTELMRGGCPAGCAVFNPYYKELYETKIKPKKV